MINEVTENKSDYGFCEMFLYRNVKNGPELHSDIMKGIVKCAMIKPSLIAHPLQVAVASKKALAAKTASISSKEHSKKQNLMTKSIFTEILYNLAPTKNIAESLKVFGLAKDDQEILIVIVKEPGVQQGENRVNKDELLKKINGDRVANIMDHKEGLPSLTNWELISKVHKFKATSNKQNDVDLLISKAATKDVS